LQVAQNITRPKPAKELAYPVARTEKIKHEMVTKGINHWADSANFNSVTSNKSCSGLTGKCFEMPNASYTSRYHALKKSATT